MTSFKFYVGWFRLGRAYWKAQQELQKLEDDCRRWATLTAYLGTPTGSIADEAEMWLAEHSEDEAA